MHARGIGPYIERRVHIKFNVIFRNKCSCIISPLQSDHLTSIPVKTVISEACQPLLETCQHSSWSAGLVAEIGLISFSLIVRHCVGVCLSLLAECKPLACVLFRRCLTNHPIFQFSGSLVLSSHLQSMAKRRRSYLCQRNHKLYMLQAG